MPRTTKLLSKISVNLKNSRLRKLHRYKFLDV
jgi:hypothetical protein